MDLVEKPKLLGQKFTEIFLQGVGDCPRKNNSLDRPLIPPKDGRSRKSWEMRDVNMQKKKTFQISLLLRVFILPKKNMVEAG